MSTALERFQRLYSLQFAVRFFAALGAACCSLGAIIFSIEWFRIGVVADPDVIARYYFGSEAMIGHGGWVYRSAALYADSALADALVLIVAAWLFTVAWRRRSWRYLGVASGVFAGLLIVQRFAARLFAQ